MRKLNQLFIGLCLGLLFSSGFRAQSKSELEDMAYDYLNNYEFTKAYDAFEKLSTRYPKEPDYKFKLGICALSCPDKKDKAILIFKEISDKNNSREAKYYLARAYHVNYKFDEAIAVLEPIIAPIENSKKKDDKAFVDDAHVIINNCKNGKILTRSQGLSSDVKNIGPPVNTSETEAVPIITADESMMIFTYVGRKSLGGKLNASLESDRNGSYLSDIYMSMRNADSTWKVPTPITSLNTKGNDAAIALSPDGSLLFTFMSTNENEGDISVSKFDGREFSKPEPLNININSPEYWEGSCSITADGKTLYFASERPNGGFGGRDIWMSQKVNDDWGPAVNLGPRINTQYDDDAPFIHPDGVTLFFSSKGHTSIGGYDIMYSTKTENNWTEPRNMGIPLNTTEDDRFYVINSKGDKGYFSSDRATADSKGGQDIYVVTPGVVGEKILLVMFKGITYGDNKPIEAKIEVSKKVSGEQVGNYTSGAVNGKYLLTFKPGSVYHLKVTAEGYDSYEEDADLETITSYAERVKDFNLYSKAFVTASPTEVKTNSPFVATAAEVAPVVAAQPAVTESTTPSGVTVYPMNPDDSKDPDMIFGHIKGRLVDADNKPLNGNIDITNMTNKDEPMIHAKVVNGEYDVKVKNGALYHLSMAADGIDDVIEDDIDMIFKRHERLKDYKLKTRAALAAAGKKNSKSKKEEKLAKTETKKEPVVSSGPCTSNLPDVTAIKGKSLNDPAVYNRMLSIAGNYCADNIIFKVQIGAYRKPENYKYPNLKSLGSVEFENYPDGITRFTQKEFKTIKEANTHRQRAIDAGQRDSWIVAFVDGKRYTLEELISLDFMGKAIN